jgi:hypothetical protein
MSEIVPDIHLNIPHLPLLSFCADSSHQTHISALIIGQISQPHLKFCSRYADCPQGLIANPSLHRAKNAFRAATNLRIHPIVFFLLIGQRMIPRPLFANFGIEPAIDQLRLNIFAGIRRVRRDEIPNQFIFLSRQVIQYTGRIVWYTGKVIR